MIVVMNTDADPDDVQAVKSKILDMKLEVYESIGLNYHLIGIVGDTSKVDAESFTGIQSVKKVIHVQEPYKKASRLFHPEDSVISVGDKTIGANKLAIIAGPCSVESREQIIHVAEKVREAGAGLPIVVELMSADKLDLYEQDVDIIQIGARNMQNFELLKAVGQTRKPILLKRGLSATIEELLMAAEYIMAGGNENIILCERGIRTFENYTRNTLDLSAIPAIKKSSHLPVIVDPSHASGIWWMVEPLAKAAVAVGADGIMVEVHNDPANALCDGSQSIKPEKFKHLVESIREIARIQNREI